jgi:hypothetical protein
LQWLSFNFGIQLKIMKKLISIFVFALLATTLITATGCHKKHERCAAYNQVQR